ncbi:MAG: hypothetical protein K2X82_30140 [Gemmataceae bacterium]|nr:hypothetical protein [Gemmataceae bacterium]
MSSPYGVVGSVIGLLQRSSAVTAVGAQVWDTVRPATANQYPVVVVIPKGYPEADYTFDGQKVQEWRVEVATYTEGRAQNETLMAGVEKVMEADSTIAEIASRVESLPDGVEIRDLGGNLVEVGGVFSDTGKRTHVGTVNWLVKVAYQAAGP